MTAFVFRFLIAGLLVACLPLIAGRAGDHIAGAVLVFPVVTVSGFVVLEMDRGMQSVAEASSAALIALPAVAAFLLGVHVSARHHASLAVGLLVGTTAWVLVAGGVVLLSTSLRGGQ